MPGSLGHEEQDAKTFAAWVCVCLAYIHTLFIIKKKKNLILKITFEFIIFTFAFNRQYLTCVIFLRVLIT